MTTAFAQTTANPDGTYTLTESATPSRVWRNGAWKALDPTLRADHDGTISPAATTSALTLSGGGSGPLATLITGGQSLSLTLPLPLPKPVLARNTATYPQVIRGVDLIVTATASGAFSDVFEVHNAAAASDPRLASLLSAKLGLSKGLTQTADTSGNVTIAEHGRPLFTAAAPYAWDSAATTGSTLAGNDLGSSATSSAQGPGRTAHLAHLAVTTGNGRLALTAPRNLTTSTATYPVFLDPTYSPSYGANAWASFGDASSVAGTNEYNKSTDPTGLAFIGLASNVGDVWSAFNFQLPDTGASNANNLVGAHIYTATFGIVSSTSGGFCNSDPTNTVDLYAPNPAGGNYLTSSQANHNYWSGHVGSVVTTANFDGAQTCSNSGAGAFTVTNAVSAEVGTAKTGNQTFVLAATDTSDFYGTKRFAYASGTAGNPVLTVNYDKAPGAPDHSTLSVGSGCGTTIGDTGVSLLAHTNDVMPFQLTTTFDLYQGTNSGSNLLTTTTATNNGINSDAYPSSPGQEAVLALPEKFLKALAPTSAITLTWQATSTDGQLASGSSDPCTFTYDPTRPGAPTITPTANSSGVTCQVAGAHTGTQPTVGSTCAFTFGAPSGATVSGYTYQLNQQAPVTVSNTANNITVTVPQIINTLTVNALSAGGNIGQSANVQFDGSALNPPAVDGSVTNDGEPDMLAAGGTGTMPDGLWLAQSTNDGALTSAANIGLNGLGFPQQPGSTLAAQWHGASIVTGDFCGLGTQDVMAYYPGGNNAGGSAAVCSTGADTQLTVGSPLSSSTATKINSAGSFSDGNNNNASQLANAYNTSGADDSVPDLFATIDNSLYLFTSKTANGYTNDSFVSTSGAPCATDCDILTGLNTPDETQDWNSWTITTAQVGTSTDMYLWNPSTGALDLWTDFTITSGQNYPNATTATYNEYTSTAPWTTGTTGLVLRAATLNPGDDASALWALNTSTGAVNAYTPSLSGTTLTMAAGATSTVKTFTHSWQFTDIPSGLSAPTEIGSTADAISGGPALQAQNTTANGATWHTGDIYDPDAMLNTATDGQSPDTALDGYLTASAPAVTMNTTFTVSAAVRPNAAGGTVLSQGGTNTAGFTLGSTTAGQWNFCMARSDTTSPTLDCATGGTVTVGLWSTLTATYDPTMGIMRLYVNGTETAVNGHAATSGFAGAFQVGDALTAGTQGSYYSGQVADISTWAADVPPSQTPHAGSDFVPVTPTRILDTRSASKVGNITGPVAAGSTIVVTIAGNITKGLTIPTTGITAAAVSITETGASTNGFITAYPDGTPLPISSTLNYAASGATTNNAIIPVGTDGAFDLYNNSTGTAQLIVDITGYYSTDTTLNNASTYVPLTTPTRILDTRPATKVGNITGPVAANTAIQLAIAPNTTAGIPTDQAGAEITAVALNLTAADATGTGDLIAYPDGPANPPVTSNLNYNTTGSIASTVIVPVATNGKIDIYNSSGTPIDIIGDVSGYYTTSTAGQHYYPAGADRLIDTRTYNPQSQSAAPVLSDKTINLPVPANITAYNPTLVLNLTVTQPTASGNLIVYPGDQTTAPGTSALNWGTVNETIANLSVAASTTGGGIKIYNFSTGSIELIVDTDGYFD